MSGAARKLRERTSEDESISARERLLLALFAAAIWLPLQVKWIQKLWASTAPGADGNDFTGFYDAALCILAGEPLYGGEKSYMYPPFFAWLMLPLLLLPVRFAGILWGAAKIPLFHYAAGVFLPERALPPRWRRWVILLSPLLVYRFLDSDMGNGNSNVYLLAGIAFVQQLASRGRDTAAGLIAAAVSAVKLSPFYLMGGLAALGRWRAALTQCVAGALFLYLTAIPTAGGVAGAWQGFSMNSMAVGTVLESNPDDPLRGYLAGTSLRPILHRWLTDSAAVAHTDERTTINLLHLDPAQVEWCYRALAGVIALLGWWVCRGRSLPWVVAWCTALLLVISPYARKAQLVFLLPAALLILEHARVVGFRRAAAPLLFLAIAIVCGQCSTRPILGKDLAALLVGGGVLFASIVAILAGLWMIRDDEHGQSNAPASH